MLGDLGINIIASVVLIGLTWLSARFLVIGRNRRVWRLRAPKELTIVIARAGTDEVDYEKPLTGVGQVRALAIVAPSLERAYPHVSVANSVLVSSGSVGHQLERDLVTLGGGKTNRVTYEVLRELQRQEGFPAGTTSRGLIWSGREFCAEREGDQITCDYGLIVQAANPFEPDRQVVVLAGASTYGTIAAARFLIAEGWKINGEWSAIVRAPVSGGFSLRPTKVAGCKLARNKVWYEDH